MEKVCCSSKKKANHSIEFKKEIKSRLNRIEGQIRGIGKMVEEDVYCDDILNQITSVRSALSGVSKKLLSQHIKSCISDRIKAGDEDSLDELLETVKKMIK